MIGTPIGAVYCPELDMDIQLMVTRILRPVCGGSVRLGIGPVLPSGPRGPGEPMPIEKAA